MSFQSSIEEVEIFPSSRAYLEGRARNSSKSQGRFPEYDVTSGKGVYSRIPNSSRGLGKFPEHDVIHGEGVYTRIPNSGWVWKYGGGCLRKDIKQVKKEKRRQRYSIQYSFIVWESTENSFSFTHPPPSITLKRMCKKNSLCWARKTSYFD